MRSENIHGHLEYSMVKNILEIVAYRFTALRVSYGQDHTLPN